MITISVFSAIHSLAYVSFVSGRIFQSLAKHTGWRVLIRNKIEDLIRTLIE